MTNKEIVQVFENIAGLLELNGELVFKIRAYQRAARIIGRLPIELEQCLKEGNLQVLPGIGTAIAKKIEELVTTGGLEYYDRLHGGFPDGLLRLMDVPGIGPKTAMRICKELGISTVHGLEKAVRDGRVADLPWMGQMSERMTERIIQAMRNPFVNVLAHPTTRILGGRNPIDADMEALFRTAAETGTALEINASPERLDLQDTHVLRAKELNVPLIINTDAHATHHLTRMHLGVAVARRGWCEAQHIINASPLDEFLEFIGRKRKVSRTG